LKNWKNDIEQLLFLLVFFAFICFYYLILLLIFAEHTRENIVAQYSILPPFTSSDLRPRMIASCKNRRNRPTLGGRYSGAAAKDGAKRT
jgi:hypothetical protein